jgi:hypothetical protein
MHYLSCQEKLSLVSAVHHIKASKIWIPSSSTHDAKYNQLYFMYMSSEWNVTFCFDWVSVAVALI